MQLVWYDTLLRNITRCVPELSGIVWTHTAIFEISYTSHSHELIPEP